MIIVIATMSSNYEFLKVNFRENVTDAKGRTSSKTVTKSYQQCSETDVKGRYKLIDIWGKSNKKRKDRDSDQLPLPKKPKKDNSNNSNKKDKSDDDWYYPDGEPSDDFDDSDDSGDSGDGKDDKRKIVKHATTVEKSILEKDKRTVTVGNKSYDIFLYSGKYLARLSELRQVRLAFFINELKLTPEEERDKIYKASVSESMDKKGNGSLYVNIGILTKAKKDISDLAITLIGVIYHKTAVELNNN